MRFRLAALVLLVSLGVLAKPSPEVEARELFDRGKAAMGRGRFDEARDLFQRSLDLVPKASAAFNLAVALRGMGKPKQSADLLARMLQGKYGELPADRRSEVESLAKEARADIATLQISARGADRIDVRVDGVLVSSITSGRNVSIQVNPGERVVTFSANKRSPVERRVSVAPGKSAKVSAALTLSRAGRLARLVVVAQNGKDDVEIEGVGRGRGRLDRRLDPGRYLIRVHSTKGSRESWVALEPATEHRVELETPSESLLSSPWLWVGAAVVVTGAVVSGYFLLQDRERDPVTDPEHGIVQTLRRR
jgi:hypothetical protein